MTDPVSLSPKHRLGFLAKDTLIYGGASALNSAFSLISFPILARYFSVADYGLVDLFSAVAGFVAILFVFGQDSAVARYFYEYPDEDERRQIVSQSLILQLLVIAAFLPFAWAFSGRIAGMLSHSEVGETLLKISLIQVPFMVLANFSQNLLKWTFSRSKFIFVSVGSVASRVAGLVVGVYVFHIDLTGLFAINLGVTILFGLIGLGFVRQWLCPPSAFGFLKEMLPFAAPYGLMASFTTFVPTLERSMVSGMLGGHELGLYAAGAKMAMLISMPIQAFQTAWGPFYLSIHKESDSSVTYNWVLKGFVLLVCCAVLFLTAASAPLLRLLASSRYDSANLVVFPLAMGLAIQGTSWITEIGIGISKKSHVNLGPYAISFLATMLSIYGLLKAGLGIAGVALGVMLGHLVKSLFLTYLAYRLHPIPWDFRRVGTVLVYTIAAGLLNLYISESGWGGAGSALMVLALLAFLPTAWIVLFTNDEREGIKNHLDRLLDSSGSRGEEM